MRCTLPLISYRLPIGQEKQDSTPHFCDSKTDVLRVARFTCAQAGDLRHPTLSRPQRLRRLSHGGYFCRSAPLSLMGSVYHVFSALSIGFCVFLKGGKDFPANVLANWDVMVPQIKNEPPYWRLVRFYFIMFSISSRSGADSAAPCLVTEIAAAALAKAKASTGDLPSPNATAKAPLKVSPAPVVSTALTG